MNNKETEMVIDYLRLREILEDERNFTNQDVENIIDGNFIKQKNNMVIFEGGKCLNISNDNLWNKLSSNKEWVTKIMNVDNVKDKS